MNIIVCDGSCLKNPGPGGWAYAVIKPNKKVEYYSGSSPKTTNNIMELTAFIKALEAGHKIAEIYTDSSYVVNGVNEWIKRWKVCSWKNSQKKLIKNLDLWQKIDQIYRSQPVKWIRGHQSLLSLDDSCDLTLVIKIQYEVDRLARQSAIECQASQPI